MLWDLVLIQRISISFEAILKKVLVVPYDSGDVGFDDQDEESDQSVQNDQGHAPNIEPCRTPNYPDLKKIYNLQQCLKMQGSSAACKPQRNNTVNA